MKAIIIEGKNKHLPDNLFIMINNLAVKFVDSTDNTCLKAFFKGLVKRNHVKGIAETVSRNIVSW
jgi:hypothetical protein